MCEAKMHYAEVVALCIIKSVCGLSKVLVVCLLTLILVVRTLSLFHHLLFNIFQQFKGWQGMANELQGMEGAIPCQSPK